MKHKCPMTLREERGLLHTYLSWSAWGARGAWEAWRPRSSDISRKAMLAFGAWQAPSWGSHFSWNALRARCPGVTCVPWGAFDAITLWESSVYFFNYI